MCTRQGVTMAKVKREDMRVGHWWALCCLNDLQKVLDADDLEVINDNEMDTFRGGWETCAEAVEDLMGEFSTEECLFLLEWNRGIGNMPEIAQEISRLLEFSKPC